MGGSAVYNPKAVVCPVATAVISAAAAAIDTRIMAAVASTAVIYPSAAPVISYYLKQH